MANSLLDFVMSVVRDADAAAAYAANPAQAIADANLTDVTGADVDNLIPVVTESLSSSTWSSAMPPGVDVVGDQAHNVWASGAATEAFDAFGDHPPVQGGIDVGDTGAHAATADQGTIAPSVIDQGFDSVIDDGGSSGAVGPDPVPFDQALVAEAPTFEDAAPFGSDAIDSDAIDSNAIDAHTIDEALRSVDDHLDHSEDPGFDIFT